MFSNKENVNSNETFGETNETTQEASKNEIQRVTNRDMFYTVSSCVEKYLNFVSAKDSEKVYNLLADEYKVNIILHKIIFGTTWKVIQNIKYSKRKQCTN